MLSILRKQHETQSLSISEIIDWERVDHLNV